MDPDPVKEVSIPAPECLKSILPPGSLFKRIFFIAAAAETAAGQ